MMALVLFRGFTLSLSLSLSLSLFCGPRKSPSQAQGVGVRILFEMVDKIRGRLRRSVVDACIESFQQLFCAHPWRTANAGCETSKMHGGGEGPEILSELS